MKGINTKYLMAEMALYEKIEISEKDIPTLYDFLMDNNGRYDCHCIECGKETTFTKIAAISRSLPVNHNTYPPTYSIPYNFYHLESLCARNHSHKMSADFLLNGEFFIKIGQYPSQADITFPQLQKYKSVLKDKFKEFKKGIGLSSHDCGIGAFVYLRRVIENLINEATEEYKLKQGAAFDEKEFLEKRTTEKISLLKDYLPETLVNNRNIYKILSLGVHELDDETCLLYFPVLKDTIELILDDIIVKKHRKLKEESIKKELQDIEKAEADKAKKK